MLAQGTRSGEEVIRYAASAEYCKIFDEQMHSLFLLAFLLTADSNKAEQCFVAGREECVEGRGVWMEGPHSWARRAIIRHAIQMIRPAQEQGASGHLVSGALGTSGTSNPFAVIVSLRAFERCAFVMSVLEGQSNEDCQSLLRCSRQEVVMARKVALRLLAATNTGWEHTLVGKYTWLELLN
jgi:DNA-directed RNA polymerase specialized sigma24 family protein